LALARQGLARRRRLGPAGDDETGYLLPLQQIVETGVTPAEKLLRRFESEWDGSLVPLFSEQAYY
jgi:glutamate--cysteine ligase